MSEPQLREAERVAAVVSVQNRYNLADRGSEPVVLARSPQILPIPGSGSPEHVAENIAAASIDLTSAEKNAISNAA